LGNLEVLLAFSLGIENMVLFTTGGFFAAGRVESYAFLISSSYLGCSFAGGELDFVSLGLTSRAFCSNST